MRVFYQMMQPQRRIGLGLPPFTGKYCTASFDINTLHFRADSVTPNTNQFTTYSCHCLNLTTRVAVDYYRLILTDTLLGIPQSLQKIQG
jgi:hypothetical protein